MRQGAKKGTAVLSPKSFVIADVESHTDKAVDTKASQHGRSLGGKQQPIWCHLWSHATVYLALEFFVIAGESLSAIYENFLIVNIDLQMQLYIQYKEW